VSPLAESRKVSAFVRRDLHIMLSYRMASFGELFGMVGQAIAFSFVGRLINSSRFPVYGGAHTGYLEFVVIGIAMNMVVIMMLHQLATAIRSEQLAGTLESLLVTPTNLATIWTGAAAFQLLFVPLRMTLFVGVLGFVFGLNYHVSGLLPSVVILFGFSHGAGDAPRGTGSPGWIRTLLGRR
jgi:ABC-type transport system involved in cytochrome c biogenesis permease component